MIEPLKLCSNWFRCLGSRGARHAALFAIAVIALAGAPRPVWAQIATWSPNPGSSDFSTASNWVPPTVVPDDTASFGTSNTTTIKFTNPGFATQIGTIELNPGAPQYIFNVEPGELRVGIFFSDTSGFLSGPGIVNNSGSSPIFNVAELGDIVFRNSSTAANAIINVAGGGETEFQDMSSAANAAINNSGILTFLNSSTGANAAITTNLGGITSFVDLVTLGTTAGSIAGAGSYLLGSTQLTVGSNGSSTEVSGTIEGVGGSLVKVGAGTLTLSGDNTYTGGTTINAGTLQLGDGTTNGSIFGNVADNAGATLAFNPAVGTTIVFSGEISGEGAVSQVGTGSTTLTEANSYAGGTLLSAGTLIAGNNSALGTGTLTVAANPSGTTTLDNTPAAAALANAIVLNPSANLIVAGSNPLTLTGAISGAGALTKDGASSLLLTEANSYEGGTLLSAGTLIAGSNSALGTGTLTVAANPSGTTLDNTLGATALANAIVLNPSANLTVAGSNPLTLAGAISGDGALTKNGASTLILTADNSYAGGTTINSGTLQVGNGGATGSVGTGPILDDSALVFNRSGTVTVPGAITGDGSLTQNGAAGGTVVLTGTNTYGGGTTISAGTLQLGDGGTTGSIIGNVANSGTLAFDRSDTVTFSGVISGTGGVNQIGSGTTILAPTTGPGGNTYGGVTTISGGTLQAGGVDVFSANSNTIVMSGGTLDLHGFDQTLNNGLTNAGLVQLGVPGITPPGTTLTVAGGYGGDSGKLNVNTFLGADSSPSDKLILSGGTATGRTNINVTNVGGPGFETTSNGILVVDTIHGATTTPGAFTLANPELRAGAFDYFLFRGGLGGSDPAVANDWFLRSGFLGGGGGGGITGGPEEPVVPTEPGEPPPVFPSVPPPTPLPPNVLFPIIGPELATYGVVQPLARQLGLSILGTLDDRFGDTYEPDGCAVQPAAALAAQTSAVDLPTRKTAAVPTKKPGPAPCPLFSPSVWGRFFGQTINNRYQAFADPRADGNLGGFQGGIDLLRGPVIPGGYDRAGLYGAYGDVNSDVTGLVTNPAATAYILTHTGSMNLDAWSAGGYWTHTGPGGWYLDAVLQGTWYYGSASTQFAKLNTDGTGFIGSLEGGYPFAWPQLGPGFVIEPQGQILWQKVSFRHDYDGLGDVALGDTTGPSGRIGLRTKWTIVTAGGQVWQPYLRGNLWRDWGAEANTVFSGTDSVPLVNQATMLEFGGGVTGRINANVSVFANVDYEFAVGSGDEKRNGVRGAFGARYTW